jgi:RNA polymerase sigma-70 factor (ECF subfamily)
MVPADRYALAGTPQVEALRDPSVGGDAAALNALAGEALAKDPDAVRRFLSAIAPAIRRVCGGVMGYDHPDLEDTIQDCLIDTMRAMPRYRFEGNVVHYVTKISIRLAIAARRRGALRSGRFQPIDEQRSADWQGESDGARIELAHVVRQIVSHLSRVQSETLILRVLLGFSIEEIASITEAPINTVKTRLRLGKNVLKRRLEEHDQAPSMAKRPP